MNIIWSLRASKKSCPQECNKWQQNKMPRLHICRCLICISPLGVVICATSTLCMPLPCPLSVYAFLLSKRHLRPSFHKLIQSRAHSRALAFNSLNSSSIACWHKSRAHCAHEDLALPVWQPNILSFFLTTNCEVVELL